MSKTKDEPKIGKNGKGYLTSIKKVFNRVLKAFNAMDIIVIHKPHI